MKPSPVFLVYAALYTALFAAQQGGWLGWLAASSCAYFVAWRIERRR